MSKFRGPRTYRLANVTNGLATVIDKKTGETVGRVMHAPNSTVEWVAEDANHEQITHARRSGPYAGLEFPMTYGSRDSAARSLVSRARTP